MPFTHERLPGAQGYKLVIHPPLADFPGQSQEADCLRVNQWVERAIMNCPSQYLWVHRRFKTRPLGEPDLYTAV
jgi:KDO2-lipid IV(A) lauroyltransferase